MSTPEEESDPPPDDGDDGDAAAVPSGPPEDPDDEVVPPSLPPPPPPPPPPVTAAAPLPPPPPPLPPLDGDAPPPASVPVPPPPASPVATRPPPRVDEVTPLEGPVYAETRIVLRGDHFDRVTVVRVGGQIAMTVGVREPSELRVLVAPLETPGNVPISVQNPGHDPVVFEQAFRYAPLAPPRLMSVTPARGDAGGGTEVSLLGADFHPRAQVTVNGEAVGASTYIDPTTIDLVMPPGPAGRAVDIVVVNPDGAETRARRAFQYDPSGA
ncbi:MAG: IPT/TIG domain-containing protein [Myxococcota bacterium]